MRTIRSSSKVLLALVTLAACTPEAAQLTPRTPESPAPSATPAAPPPPDEPDTSAEADAIIQKHIAARGGLDKLSAIKTVRITGRSRWGVESPTEVEYAEARKRGGFVRYEQSFQGLTGAEAYDGADAWSYDPFGGRREAIKESADDARLLAADADIDGPLVGWREKGHMVSYLGTEDIDGTPAHKIRVRRKEGDLEYHYLDPDAYLTIRVVNEVKIRGAERITEVDFGDYELVAGVWLPFSIAQGSKGGPRTSRTTVQRIEVNVALDDGLFRFPAAGAKVSRSLVADPNAPPPPPVPASGATTVSAAFDSGVISGLGARNIGSAAMSGRISAVAAHHDQGKLTLYVGSASGGVWKSSDGGTTFKPIFDKASVQSIGAVALDPQNHQTVWVGTGESWTRNSVSIGDGIYKSTDGGATFHHMGLPESERITRIIVHPKNGSVVWACVPGKLWSDSPDRGVYKTEDGGKSWSLVLKGTNLSTGCSGLSLDPTNPDVLFAGMWDFRRKGWTFRSGGDGPDAPSGSGLHRSADGGKTWTKLDTAANKGLPAGPWGRVEVAVAPSDAKIVYALIESKSSALYRSSDGGATWEERSKADSLVWRPFYFARLVIDPKNPDRIFKPASALVVSEDGGRSFAYSGGQSHGDWHDLWIDPENTKHIVGGDDGGFWTSFDGGVRWWKSNNLPVSQFYHVSVDDKDPYRVYGGLQDNSSWVGESAYPGGIGNAQWENLYNGDGFWAMVDPTDPDAVYAEWQGGNIGRIDRRTKVARDIQPKAGYKEKLRFNWNTPIHLSPNKKGTLYIGAQFLFRSKDRGDTWERISPDLTTNDPQKQKQEESGGVTVDNSSAEMHTTIYAISESPKDAKVIWAGTDDGNLQITRDGGKSWTNVIGNVPGLPKASWVSWVEASRFDAGTAYAAFDRHTFGDMTPWVYRTTDHGQTWTRIASAEKGARGYAHVIKEDVVKPDLLFLGTELGLFISADGGGRWAEFKGGDFPSVAVREIQVHPREHDLVLATHGRGIWIIDDVSPLRALGADALARGAAFLPARRQQQRMQGQGGWVEGDASFTGRNPPGGVVITYVQRTRHLRGPLRIEILDEQGKVVDTLDPSSRRGINRVVWSMQRKPPRAPRGATLSFGATQGPRVLPGTYTVRLTKGSEKVETKIDVALDRRAPYKLADRKANDEAAMRAYALFEEMSGLAERIEAAQAGTAARAGALPKGDPLADKLDAAGKKLEEARKKIVATKEGGAITGEERLREHLDRLYSALLGWEGKPARYQIERLDVLTRELREVAAEFEGIVSRDLRPLDAELRNHKLDPVPDRPRAEGEAAGGTRLVEGGIRCVRPHGGECLVSAAGRRR